MLRSMLSSCYAPPPAAAIQTGDRDAPQVQQQGSTSETLSRLRSRSGMMELSTFTYDQLSSATRNFTEILGEGAFGKVYKGELQIHPGCDPVLVAVKHLSEVSNQGLNEFEAELKTYTHIRHRNLVKLLGWCLEPHSSVAPRRVLIVYEFIPKGNLENLIHSKEVVTWSVRLEIIRGVGQALLYLHYNCSSDACFLHRDIKCSNIMLEQNYNPKLGDFGLSRKVDGGSSSYRTERFDAPIGTRGYMAPELHNDSPFTKETDVYSFGVVLLQVASGRRPLEQIIDPSSKFRSGRCNQPLIEWVWDLHHQNRLLEAADRRLHHMFNDEEMKRVLIVGLACCHPHPDARLNIQEAMDVLLGSSQLPSLPSSMPRLPIPR